MNFGHLLTLTLALSACSTLAGQSPAPGPVDASRTAYDVEFDALVAKDEAAQAEVGAWRREARAAAGTARPITDTELERRIRERLEPIDKAYADFIRRYPNHARARLTYGCFLNDRQEEAAAQAQWEKALELDPQNADACNNLAGRYAEIGPAKKAFEFYSRAVALKPAEAVYQHNFADTLYVLRSHAMTNYGLSEQQVFSRALLLYSNAARLEPTNANFAWDFAQTYYALKPVPCGLALQAWTNALVSASTPVDREQIYLQLARVKMLAGQLAEARAQLLLVTNESTAKPKAALLRAIEERDKP
jgi:Tfp pilus assembly protein PilF